MEGDVSFSTYGMEEEDWWSQVSQLKTNETYREDLNEYIKESNQLEARDISFEMEVNASTSLWTYGGPIDGLKDMRIDWHY
jgi:hypothetical protein